MSCLSFYLKVSSGFCQLRRSFSDGSSIALLDTVDGDTEALIEEGC